MRKLNYMVIGSTEVSTFGGTRITWLVLYTLPIRLQELSCDDNNIKQLHIQAMWIWFTYKKRNALEALLTSRGRE